MKPKPPYVEMRKTLYDHPDMTPDALVVYYILGRASWHGETKMSLKELARQTRMAKNSAMKALKILEECGHIVREQRRSPNNARIANTYTLPALAEHPPSAADDLGLVHQMDKASAADDLGLVHQLSHPSAQDDLPLSTGCTTLVQEMDKYKDTNPSSNSLRTPISMRGELSPAHACAEPPPPSPVFALYGEITLHPPDADMADALGRIVAYVQSLGEDGEAAALWMLRDCRDHAKGQITEGSLDTAWDKWREQHIKAPAANGKVPGKYQAHFEAQIAADAARAKPTKGATP